MNFTDNILEPEMKKPPRVETAAPAGAPGGSRCDRCPYWKGIRCVACYRDLLRNFRGR